MDRQLTPEEFESMCTNLNLDKGTVGNLLKSEPSRKAFIDVVRISGLKEADKKVGNLLFGVSSKLPDVIQKHRAMLA